MKFLVILSVITYVAARPGLLNVPLQPVSLSAPQLPDVLEHIDIVADKINDVDNTLDDVVRIVDTVDQEVLNMEDNIVEPNTNDIVRVVDVALPQKITDKVKVVDFAEVQNEVAPELVKVVFVLLQDIPVPSENLDRVKVVDVAQESKTPGKVEIFDIAELSNKLPEKIKELVQVVDVPL